MIVRNPAGVEGGTELAEEAVIEGVARPGWFPPLVDFDRPARISGCQEDVSEGDE
jgi:hypothetical protein